MSTKYKIEYYKTDSGQSPFPKWLSKLKSVKARVRIAARIGNMQQGNIGDYKAIRGHQGLFEARIHISPGYRLYFTMEQRVKHIEEAPGVVKQEVENVIILLNGGIKRNQKRDLARAAGYL